MCFVRACNTAFLVKDIVLKLSQRNKCLEIGISSSENIDLDQQSSAAQLATLQYSASVDDQETVCCFLAAMR